MVSFQDNDEKFTFECSPIEIFFKYNSRVLHVFCFLNNFKDTKCFDNIILNDDQSCNVKHCILSDSSHFLDNCINIACKNQELINSVLGENVPEKDLKFLQHFDEFLHKYENEKSTKLGEKTVIEKHPKLNTKSILENVLQLVQEKQCNKNSNWIMDYQRKFTSDEDDLEEDIPMEPFEEPPPSPQMSDKYDSDSMDASNKTLKKKLANKLTEIDKRCNLNDMFVINISRCFVRIKNKHQTTSFDGLAIQNAFIPFEDSVRDLLLEKIKG